MDDHSLQAVFKSIEAHLQCPVCLNSIHPAASFCVNGHGVCIPCRENLVNCPLCKKEIVVEKATLFNQILECLPIPCPFSEEGCKFVMLDREHKEYCEYRPTKCMIDNCTWSGTVKYLLNHVKALHNNECYEVLPDILGKNTCFGNYCIPEKSRYLDGWSLITFNGHLFWKYFQRRNLRNLPAKYICHTFYHLPTTKPKLNYYFVVTFSSGDFEFSSTYKASVEKYSGNVPVNADTSFLKIPDHLLKRFQAIDNKDWFIEYRYMIKVVSEIIRI